MVALIALFVVVVVSDRWGRVRVHTVRRLPTITSLRRQWDLAAARRVISIVASGLGGVLPHHGRVRHHIVRLHPIRVSWVGHLLSVAPIRDLVLVPQVLFRFADYCFFHLLVHLRRKAWVVIGRHHHGWRRRQHA